jgi:hypothetical protein
MNDQQALRRRLAPAAVRVVGFWILSVALIKLFKGTPNDLPKLVQDFLPGVDLGLKLRIAVAIELTTGVLALLQPRLGWILQVPMLTLFVGMLIHMTATGVASCGCFGKLSVPPPVMLALDSVCLAAILLTRPWSSLPRAPLRPLLLAPVLAVAIGAPWLVIGREPDAVPVFEGPWHLPEELPRFAILNPRRQEWLGKEIRRTELGIWIDTDQYPQDATWILYRITCEHCAKELAELAAKDDGQTTYVLVRIPEENEEKYRQVHTLPPIAAEALLPPITQYVGQTPWTLRLEGGVVKDIRAGEGVDDTPGARSGTPKQ